MYNLPLFIKHPQNLEFASPRLKNNPAPHVDRYFYEELIHAGGRDRFGEPRMRLVWMQSLTRIVNGKERLKYAAQTWGDAWGDYYDIGFPRFMIEQKIDPIFCDLASWNVRLQGPVPRHGMYLDLMCIQTADGHFCYPDRRHITELKAMDYNKRHDALYHSAEEVAPEYVRQQKIKKLDDADRERKRKVRDARRFMIRDHIKDNLHRITHPRPLEGKHRDPYAEAKKQREKAS